MLRFRFSAALVLVAGAAAAQTPHPPEKVRVTYEATAGCPGPDAFLAQVRERVGTGWEAPPNVLARTIEVRVTGGGDRSVARIDFVDENNQPITRVVTAKTCDEVVTGIALVTALAIESRIAEAVGKSEPATAPTTEPPAATATQRASGEPKVQGPPPAPTPAPPPTEEPSPPPRYDVGAGALMSFGMLPEPPTFGIHTFMGLEWRSGLSMRVGFDAATSGIVRKTVDDQEYQSRFSFDSFRLSVCPFALGETVRLLPCGGVEVGWLRVTGLDSSSRTGLDVQGRDGAPLWLAPVVSLRGDATWEVFFAELEVSLAVPILPTQRDFVFQRTTAGAAGTPTTKDDTVHTIWPVAPSASLSLGLRI